LRNHHFGKALPTNGGYRSGIIELKRAMGTEISGDGSGSRTPASTIIELKKKTVDVDKDKSKDGESGKVEQSKPMGKETSDGAGSRPVDPRVARRRQDPLGRRLRQMYDEVVSEDVPDDFLSFLEKADERLTGGGGDGGSGSDDSGNSKP
jgi:hypothetical protein